MHAKENHKSFIQRLKEDIFCEIEILYEALKQSFKLASSSKCLTICSFISIILSILAKDYVAAFYSALFTLGFGSFALMPTRKKTKIKLGFQTIKERLSKIGRQKTQPTQTLGLEKEKEDHGYFLNEIEKDIAQVLQAKYPDYERDALRLKGLALKFIKAKRKQNATSDMDILNIGWMKELVIIEEDMKQKQKSQESSIIDEKALEQIEQMLAAANIAPTEYQIAPEEESGQKLSLRL